MRPRTGSGFDDGFHDHAEIGRESCFFSSRCDSFRINALTSSLATLELLSARDARNVFKTSVSSASGRTVTPFRATNKAPIFTRKAHKSHQPVEGNASSGAVRCLIRDGLTPRLSARRIIPSYKRRDGAVLQTVSSNAQLDPQGLQNSEMPICLVLTSLYKKDFHRSSLWS